MRKYSLSSALLASLFVSSGVSAGNVTITGTIPGSVPLYHSDSRGLTSSVDWKEISFERILLSDQAKQYLAEHINHPSIKARLAANTLPSRAFVGMNGVPVLDQGRHGTCVSFATIGAIDATANAASEDRSYDRYSELCSLELGSTLEAQSPVDSNGEHTYPSGWDGSWATIVLNQVSNHGLISKDYQQKNGCAGVFDYPTSVGKDHGKPMSITDYDLKSEKIVPPMTYNILMNSDDAFTPKVDTEEVLANVKTAIVAKHRVTFGTLLDVDRGSNGALGTYKSRNDTWVLTSEIAEDAKAGKIEAGHEMIIIGYDDNAEVSDFRGDLHKGVLTLRNSWGEKAGDHGNYYMTYDHFKALVLEAAEYIPSEAKR